MKVAAAIAMVLGLALGVAARPADAKDGLEIRTVSTRPDTVSGGDVLVEVEVPAGVPLGQVSISLNGRDVTAAFRPRDEPRSLLGLVAGLRLGDNEIEAALRGKRAARLTVVNHPITGPVISGPHQTPYICQTEAFGLGAPLDADCSVETRVEYLYRSSTTNRFQPLPAGPRPADLAQTTTNEGRTVPYVVRRETGTINRAVYQIAFLHEPGTALPTPWAGTPGWNGRLVYNFGGGCRAGYYQGRSVGQPFPLGQPNLLEELQYGDSILARGFALASSSLNVFGTTCADVISTESMMMVKEHFIERFGVPRYTIGTGRSGGSMQQHLIGNNYPGLLDGLIPTAIYADTITFFTPLFDCELLDRAVSTSALAFSDAQKQAAFGHLNPGWCGAIGTRYPNLRPRNCDPVAIPAALVYDAVANPRGVRCTYQDNMVNIYGRDPETGFARRYLDNVGVQYGLGALNRGAVSFEQFLDLNARAGGFDIDGNVVPERTVADARALRIAYETGRMNEAGLGLRDVPMITVRPYAEGLLDVHDSIHDRILRARLIAANGHADNQVLVILPPGPITTPSITPYQAMILDAMDAWLANIASDGGRGSLARKVVRNKPAGLVDACYTASGERVTDPARCAALYPTASSPRLVAGEPLTMDRLKCALKPVDPADYTPALTAAQLAQVASVFPDGVCDYSRPGIGQRAPKDTWLAYPREGRSVRLDAGR